MVLRVAFLHTYNTHGTIQVWVYLPKRQLWRPR